MGISDNTDQSWQTWGKKDPYFAVLNDPKFLNANLSSDSLSEFFGSGHEHIEHVYGVVRARIRPTFQPTRVLDYGCGVGRLVIPLAQRAQTVVGVDVSPAMLEQARWNCEKFGLGSVRLLNVDEMASLKAASFDLVHSCIVFQHIPVARGELILRNLIALIAEGGVGAIHVTYSDTRPAFRRRVATLRQRLSLVNGLVNLVRHRPFTTPMMQMNSYSMNRIFDILMDGNCSGLHIEFTDHCYRGAMLYFEKLAKPPS
jgi:2-polyprenyl-3-methyl-5-hydroxy-6-metoxy-1,4-benzoquinol methylase